MLFVWHSASFVCANYASPSDVSNLLYKFYHECHMLRCLKHYNAYLNIKLCIFLERSIFTDHMIYHMPTNVALCIPRGGSTGLKG